MIQKPEYVKELLKKQQEGSLTAMEAGSLKAARMLYSDKEWLDMITDVLWETGAKHPNDSLAGWKPDFNIIVKKSARANLHRKYWRYGKWASIVGAAILLISLLFPELFQFSLFNLHQVGACADRYHLQDIPLNEFSCRLKWSNSAEIKVDSTKQGLIAHLPYLDISRDETGTLTFLPIASLNADTNQDLFVQVRTTSFQQCEVILPDKSRFRLNAASSLTYYPRANTDTTVHYVRLEGTGYVHVNEKATSGRLIIETANGQLQATDARFAVKASPWETRATLLDGNLTTFSKQDKRSLQIDRAGEVALIQTVQDVLGKKTESFITGQIPEEDAVRWMKTTHIYKNASLREFVREMSQWYGLKVKNINCIPDGRVISAAVCYQAQKEVVLDEIRKTGLWVTEESEKNLISFCEPNPIKDFKRQLALLLTEEFSWWW